MKLKWTLAIGSTLLALCVSIEWGFALARWPISVLFNTSETQAEIIQRVMPFHIVKPEWIKPSADGELIFPWLIAETKTRIALIGLIWAVLMVGVWKIRRSDPPILTGKSVDSRG